MFGHTCRGPHQVFCRRHGARVDQHLFCFYLSYTCSSCMVKVEFLAVCPLWASSHSPCSWVWQMTLNYTCECFSFPYVSCWVLSDFAFGKYHINRVIISPHWAAAWLLPVDSCPLFHLSTAPLSLNPHRKHCFQWCPSLVVGCLTVAGPRWPLCVFWLIVWLH